MVPVTLELGGKSPLIVYKDVVGELDAVVEQAYSAVMFNSGALPGQLSFSCSLGWASLSPGLRSHVDLQRGKHHRLTLPSTMSEQLSQQQCASAGFCSCQVLLPCNPDVCWSQCEPLSACRPSLHRRQPHLRA